LALDFQVEHFEVSAKTNENIDNMFHALVRSITAKRGTELEQAATAAASAPNLAGAAGTPAAPGPMKFADKNCCNT
jgi:GTPase SAR1 family protein